MAEKEKYLKLREETYGLMGKITGLKNEIVALKESFDPLEQESLKLEILGNPQASSKKTELAKGRDRVRALEAELDEATKKVKIMSELLPQFRHDARGALSSECLRTFGKAVVPFIKKLREVTEMEQKLVEMRLAANREFGRFDLADSPIQAWEPILKMSGGCPTLREWEEWVKKLEAQGFEIR